MEKSELRKIFYGKKESSYINKGGKRVIRDGFKSATTLEMFKAWFVQEKFEKGCYYCGTTNARSLELYNLRPQVTRGGKRGKRLELVRNDPHKLYDDLDNLVVLLLVQ